MDAPDYYCLCGTTHVLTGAKWIGIVGTAVCVWAICCGLFGQSLPLFTIALLTVPFYVSLLYAYRMYEARLYLPFLLINGLEILFALTYALFLVAMLLTMPTFWHRHLVYSLHDGYYIEELLDENAKNKMRYNTALLLLLVAVLEACLCWFQTIVLRAYEYMCVEHHTLIPPQLHPAFVLTKQQKQKLGVPAEEGGDEQRVVANGGVHQQPAQQQQQQRHSQQVRESQLA